MNWKFIYTSCFFLFAVVLLFLPGWISSPPHQLVLSLTGSVDSSAQAAGSTVRDSLLYVLGKTEEKKQKKKEFQKKQNIEELQSQLITTRLQNLELKKLLNLKQELKYLREDQASYIYLARIRSIRETSPWRNTLILNRGGTSEGNKPPPVEGLPVVYGRRLVGRLIKVGSRTSRVQVMTDPKFTISAFAMPVSESDDDLSEKAEEFPKEELDRRTGIIEGTGTKKLELKEILSSVPVKKGWKIITAGGPDSPIPMGLTIGTVTNVESLGRYLQIYVEPAVDPANIRDVMMLRSREK